MKFSEFYKNFDSNVAKFKINQFLRYKISHRVLGTTKLFMVRKILIEYKNQGILTEGEGSVQLTSSSRLPVL
jgi:hypothetical protein